MNDKAVYRTAPATLGLLKIILFYTRPSYFGVLILILRISLGLPNVALNKICFRGIYNVEPLKLYEILG